MEAEFHHRKIATGDAAVRALEDPVLRGLAEYWESKKDGRKLPRAADLDPPLEIPRLTAHMSLIVAEGDPPRFKYKRMGSAIVQDRKHRQVKDATGRYADEVDFHQPLIDVVGAFAQVVGSGLPYREAGQYRSGDYFLLYYEWVVLPLAGDDGRVTTLMSGYITRASE